jgi:uroporphyrinogen-III decarboxylase
MYKKEKSMDKTPEELYKERLKRIDDVIQLKVPDRVPFFPLTHFLAAGYVGLSAEEAFYQTDKWFAANKTMILDLEPDLYFPPATAVYPGNSLDILQCTQLTWPGHGSPPNSTYQFVEREYMKADEYDAFLSDPADFIVRVYLPRIFKALEPFQKLPSLTALFIQGYKGSVTSAVLTNPEITQAFKALYEAGIESASYLAQSAKFDKDMAALGFPQGVAASIYVAFDYISDMLRGMRGVMLDMYRQPDKLIEAMDRIFPILTNAGIAAAKRSGNPRVWIALHRGSDGFLSPKQFEKFYWPWLRKLFLTLIEEGLTPCPFVEGDYTSRLHYFRELPKGKILAFIDATDIFKAKEIIGDRICIAGDMPPLLLQTGTPEQIRDHAKKLIDTVGRDGGFVMAARTVLDDANPQLVKVWADFTREYGVYSSIKD